MTDTGPPRERRPGDGNDDSDGKLDPNAQFLGQQASTGNSAGIELGLQRLVRWWSVRRGGRG